MKKIFIVLFAGAFAFGCNPFKKKNAPGANGDAEVVDDSDKNPTELYMDSLQRIPAMAKQAEQIISSYSPFTIKSEGGKYYLYCFSEGAGTLKKYPMDTLLARKGEFYLYDDFDHFNDPGSLKLTNCYVGKGNDQVQLSWLDLDVDVKDSPGKAYLHNNTRDKSIKHIVFTVKIIINDKDTIGTEKVDMDANVGPLSAVAVDFSLKTISKKTFGSFDGVYTYIYKLEDYTLE